MNRKWESILNSEIQFKKLYVVAFLCLFLGYFFQYCYWKSSEDDIDYAHVEDVLKEKENYAIEQFLKIKQSFEDKTFRSEIVMNDAFFIETNRKGISFVIFSEGKPFFWNNNHCSFSIDDVMSHKRMVECSNSMCEALYDSIGKYKLVALIGIKHTYPYENNYLQNSFYRDFNLDKSIQLTEVEGQAVHSSIDAQPLFSLKKTTQVYNKRYAFWGNLFYGLSFVLLLFWYYCLGIRELDKKLLKNNLLIYGLLLLGLWLSMRFMTDGLPETTIFVQPIFGKWWCPTLEKSLTLASLIWLASYLFCRLSTFDFKSKIYSIVVGLLVPFLSFGCFWLMVSIIKTFVLKTSIDFTIQDYSQFTKVYFLIYAIIFICFMAYYFIIVAILRGNKNWKISLGTQLIILLIGLAYFIGTKQLFNAFMFVLIHAFFVIISISKNAHKSLWSVFFFCLIISAIVVFNIYDFQIKKDFQFYENLSKELLENGNHKNNEAEIASLKSISKGLERDSLFMQYLQKGEDIDSIYNYLNINYLNDEWNIYNMRVSIVPENEIPAYETYDVLHQKIDSSYFYLCKHPVDKLLYLGELLYKNNRGEQERLVIEIERKDVYNYAQQERNILGQTGERNYSLSMAWYENGKMQSFYGPYQYLYSDEWIKNQSDAFYSFSYNDYLHFVRVVGDNQLLVISKNDRQKPRYWFSITYLLLAYFITCVLLIFIDRWLKHKKIIQPGLFSKLQTGYIVLFIFSFACLGAFSLNFFSYQSNKRQRDLLQTNAQFVRKTLENEYGNNEKLLPEMSSELNAFLADLSNQMQVDVNLYDLSGRLIATSQPDIFEKGLINQYVFPITFFRNIPERLFNDIIGNLRYLSYYTTFYNDSNKEMGYIMVPSFASNIDLKHEVFIFMSIILMVYFIIAFFSLLISLLLSRKITKPLKMVRQKLQDFQLQQTNEHLEYKNEDELGDLIKQYNLMVDELEVSAKKLADSERESAWREMARQIAHEIKNPLTPMKLSLQQMRRLFATHDVRFEEYFEKSTGMLVEQIDTLTHVANTFSRFAKTNEFELEDVDLVDSVRKAQELFCNNDQNIAINLQLNDLETCVIRANKEQLRQVFNNLIKNALQASKNDTEITISLRIRDFKSIVEIADQGSGISEALRDKVFQPNFTTKSSGMGLGLAITKNIITSLGGEIYFETSNAGTTFYIELPLKDK